jgi:hypothetical protein
MYEARDKFDGRACEKAFLFFIFKLAVAICKIQDAHRSL